MPRRFWIAALSIWPGVPQIWTGQEVMGLILAISFAVVLNLSIIATRIWTDAFSPGMSTFFTALAAGLWVAGWLYTIWWLWRCHPDRYRVQIDQLYRDAMSSYLQGRWNEARRRFEKILAMDDTDADVLMQLGTLYLRTEQPNLARRAFRQCAELEGGKKWRWEIEQSLKRLEPSSHA